VVLGFKLKSILDLLTVEKGCKVSVETANILRVEYQREAIVLIDIAAVIAKIRYDNKYTPTEFEVGEIVYLRLYKGYSLLGKLGRKMSP
jgi:hypothetical protein